MEQVLGVIAMVLNANVNKMSVISLRSVLLVEETGVPGKSNYGVSSTPRHERDSKSQFK